VAVQQQKREGQQQEHVAGPSPLTAAAETSASATPPASQLKPVPISGQGASTGRASGIPSSSGGVSTIVASSRPPKASTATPHTTPTLGSGGSIMQPKLAAPVVKPR
jgi:hypothetical protein